MPGTIMAETKPEEPKPAKTFKRKRKAKASTTPTVTYTLAPTWAYIHIGLLTTPPSTPVDALTLRSCLLQALSSYLGDHGAAIPIDILHIGEDVESSGIRRPAAYIRVPHDDMQAVVAGISSFTGSGAVMSMRVKGQSAWLATLAGGGDGQELFTMTAEGETAGAGD